MSQQCCPHNQTLPTSQTVQVTASEYPQLLRNTLNCFGIPTTQLSAAATPHHSKGPATVSRAASETLRQLTEDFVSCSSFDSARVQANTGNSKDNAVTADSSSQPFKALTRAFLTTPLLSVTRACIVAAMILPALTTREGEKILSEQRTEQTEAT